MTTLKSKNMVKTYSRQLKTEQPPSKADAEPPPKRRRIDDYFKRAAPPSTPKRPRIEVVEEEQPAPSSSPRAETLIFSDVPRDPTPPSSPPSLHASPVHRVRKPAFAVLARDGLAGSKREPLSERSNNALKKPFSKQSLTQMKIDVGTETRKKCTVCGMEYLLSNDEDVAIHKKFHASCTSGMELRNVFLEQTKANRIWQNGTGTCIVVVGRNDTPAIRRKALAALEIVNSELGAVPIGDDELWSQSVRPGAEQGGKQGATGRRAAKEDRFRVFLYVHDQRCVGLCLAERISQAYRVLAAVEKDGKSSPISLGDETDDALLGISRIWTSAAQRRMGVAQALLDTAADNFLYGMEVCKEQVAFSQPTESGARLARRWFGREAGWHVYVE